MMSIKFSPKAFKQYVDLSKTNKVLFKQLNEIIIDTQRNGVDGKGHPERLSGNLAGWWSKHIDHGNRLVFRIVEDTVEIAMCCSHYGDK
jgi:toxin YoeB